MPKLKQLEAWLDDLEHLKQKPLGDRTRTTLREALNSKLGVVVGKAARTVAALNLVELTPDLAIAYDRLTQDPIHTDPGCLGKVDIVDALQHLQQREYDLLLRGTRYQQWEPIWGGQEDRASLLRGRCALVLADLGYADTLFICGDLLADPEVETRVETAQAIARYGNVYGIPLLRLKALSGESSSQVMEAIFSSLLVLHAEHSDAISFIAQFLDSEGDAAAVAAIALGDARHPEAFAKLRAWSEACAQPHVYQAAYAAMATMRIPDSLDYLIEKVECGTERESAVALKSLEPFRNDLSIWARVETALDRGR